LPRRDNGFGNTLGFYGVGPGPYLFLPFVGPTSVRDLIGGQGDGLVLPLAVGKPFDRLEYQIPRGVVTGLDLRAESDAELRALFDGAVDPYATLRSAYQQSRQGEIDALRGGARTASPRELEDDLADPAGSDAAVGEPASKELADPLVDPATVPKR
jgi:phospholipid-binding lipoprotein MlaA